MKMSVGNHKNIHGNYEHVVGNHNKCAGDNCHITGNHNQSTGNDNHVTGNHNYITGNRNHIVGNHNKIYGNENTASGRFNYINDVLQDDNGDDVNTVNFGGPGDGFQIQYNNGRVVNTFGIKSSPKKTKVEEPLFTECPLSTDQDEAVPDDDDDSPACVVCTTNKPVCVVMPCMHKSVCCACARVLCSDGTKERGQVKCPICQAEVHKIAKIYE